MKAIIALTIILMLVACVDFFANAQDTTDQQPIPIALNEHTSTVPYIPEEQVTISTFEDRDIYEATRELHEREDFLPNILVGYNFTPHRHKNIIQSFEGCLVVPPVAEWFIGCRFTW